MWTNRHPFISVYNSVSLGEAELEENLDVKEAVQKWLRDLLDDPIVRILTKNSHLTFTQLETLLIDLLADGAAGRTLRFDEKASLRVSREAVTRGAFNRTLRQARTNVIRTLYTILLLGYLGVLETPRLEPYLEVGGRLRSYVEAYREARDEEERRHLLNVLGREIEETLKRLSEPRTLSRRNYA